MTLKLIVSWIFGGILITLSAWMLGNADGNAGVSQAGYIMVVLLAFILILIGGLAWINVAVATSKH